MLPEDRASCSPDEDPLQFLVDTAWNGSAPAYLRCDAARAAKQYLTDAEARQVLPALLYRNGARDGWRG